MHWLTPLFALSLAALAARACSPGDDHAHGHGHVHERRAYPQVQLAPPSRPLEWGDVNIIHTTDSHGWLLGHQKSSFPEPNYRYVAPRLMARRVLINFVAVTWATSRPS